MSCLWTHLIDRSDHEPMTPAARQEKWKRPATSRWALLLHIKERKKSGEDRRIIFVNRL
ncbi:hypothetical protein [Alkalihalobacterium chitinilyticum]|uniref:Uncharacterized protein n=1 Tax=Alkalihalobacterium chitinilyticum TaxID=2980103 RepID=A0ABT5VCA9_9BACI|nr:hypothetical protein [Alkalihalobacterium chitinilyticum]MDE5412362.1 hypothetical protein [Alkalihalobacterium chitinilyticum]